MPESPSLSTLENSEPVPECQDLHVPRALIHGIEVSFAIEKNSNHLAPALSRLKMALC